MVFKCRLHGNEHLYRTQGGTGQFIAYNDSGNVVHAKSSVQIRGDGTRNVVVLGNKLEKWLGMQPQNDVSTEFVSHCLVEGDTVKDYLRITARNVAVRNNLFSDHLYLHPHPLAGISDRIRIYHHTFYGNMAEMIRGEGTRLAIKNNSYYSTSALKYAKGINLYHVPTAAVEIYRNGYWLPNKTVEIWNSIGQKGYNTFTSWQNDGMDVNSHYADPEFIPIDPADDHYLKPTASSPLINSGGDVPVFTDFEGKPRDTINRDIGAFAD